MTDWVYDLETYPNVFTFDALQAGAREHLTFEISWRRDDRRDLLQWCAARRVAGDRMIGFNNLGFDYPVLHWLIQNHERVSVLDIYHHAMRIINTEWNNRFAHIIWDRDQFVPQVDLLKIHHFDNVAKATSLKVLEFNMRSEDVRDLPFAPGSLLTWDETDILIRYNRHDVDQTDAFRTQSAEQIRFREELTEKYGRNFINHNDTKIGKDYFLMELERLVPGFDRKRQTPRESIPVGPILFGYIRFSHPEFQRVHYWLQQHTIINTKGDLDLSCSINGFDFHFGTGGIHGSVTSRIVEADETYTITDLDVASYYPNLAIANRLYPEHLGEQFCDIYADVYEQRKQYAKGTAENAMLKLALNGVFGDSNSEYSPFYDPRYTMSITLNGQLLLCMLAEALMKHPQVEIIQINTDGVTLCHPREICGWVIQVMDWWERLTHLQLEAAEYSRMMIRDVNNYIAEYTDGKLKRKGAYAWKLGKEIGWHQNHSALVIPMAAEAALVRGEDIRTFIENHDDPMDFMLRTKVPRNSRLVLQDYHGVDHPQQNVSRYYISVLGGSLVKVMPPLKGKTEDRRIGIHTGWKATIANRVDEIDFDSVEFDYYVQEARKLVDPLLAGGR